MACSYDLGGGSSVGGAGSSESTTSIVYVTSNGPASTVGNASSGGPASTTVATTDASVAASTADTSSATTGMPAVCGNGVLEDGETCEPGGQVVPDPFCFNCSVCNGGRYAEAVGRCYTYGPTNDGFDDVGQACGGWIPGATLAQPKDADLRAAMNALVPDNLQFVYFGLRRVEGNLQWVDGSPFDGTGAPWSQGQPNGEFHCAVVQSIVVDHQWFTAGCENVTDIVGGYVCEWKPS